METEYAAREAIKRQLAHTRMDIWFRGKCSSHDFIAEHRAQERLDDFVARLTEASEGIEVIGLLHRDPYMHVHAAIKLSRRLRRVLDTDNKITLFLRTCWPYGEVWWVPFEHEAWSRAIDYTFKEGLGTMALKVSGL